MGELCVQFKSLAAAAVRDQKKMILATLRYLPAVFAALYTLLEYLAKRLLRIPVSYPGGHLSLSPPPSLIEADRTKTKATAEEREVAERGNQGLWQLEVC